MITQDISDFHRDIDFVMSTCIKIFSKPLTVADCNFLVEAFVNTQLFDSCTAYEIFAKTKSLAKYFQHIEPHFERKEEDAKNVPCNFPSLFSEENSPF